MPDRSPTTARRSAAPGRSGRTYHHGDLAQALQRAVIELVAERGIGAVTMAECARRAGVSAAAPYRHYPSLDDLLLATARACYERWQVRRAEHGVDLERPEQALRELMADTFAFARDDPGSFILIFDSGIQRHSDLIKEWNRQAYEQFQHIISAITAVPAAQCNVSALGIIAVVLGHAKMSLDGFSGLSLDRAAQMSMSATALLLDGFTADQKRHRAVPEQTAPDDRPAGAAGPRKEIHDH